MEHLHYSIVEWRVACDVGHATNRTTFTVGGGGTKTGLWGRLLRCRAYSLGDLVVGGGVSKSPEKPIRKQRGDEKQGHGGPKRWLN